MQVHFGVPGFWFVTRHPPKAVMHKAPSDWACAESRSPLQYACRGLNFKAKSPQDWLGDMTHNESGAYIDIEDAAELTGYAVKHLHKLAKGSKISLRKLNNRELILWSDVQILACQQKPFWVALPDTSLRSDNPDPALLLHRDSEDAPKRYAVEDFQDKVMIGNCIEWMRRMPSKIVQSVVTSPPYWGVRKYSGSLEIRWADGIVGALGEEKTVEGYVAHSLEVLRHLKRVLRDDGTIWWNLGDTYQTRAYLRESSTERLRAFEGDRKDTWRNYPNKRYSSGHTYLKDKDLTLVPFLVALGAEHLGFYVRAVIVWSKDNTLPEPTTDRPTTSHEYILLLTKSRFYKYDESRQKEAAVTGEVIKRINGTDSHELLDKRKLRTVWQFPTSSRHGDHTAAFPIELPLRCLRLATMPGDLVFDPFAGSGTTLAAAKILGCHYFGCDIVEESVEDAKRRVLAPTQPLNGHREKRSAPTTGGRTRKTKDKPKEPGQYRLLDGRPRYETKPG
jgi:DNA modification methylase